MPLPMPRYGSTSGARRRPGEVGEQAGQVGFVERVLVLFFVELAKLAGVQFVGNGERHGHFFAVLYIDFAAANGL